MGTMPFRSELARYLQPADHQDIKTIDGEIGLRRFVAEMLSYHPWWILMLYRIREMVVNLLGLVKHPRPETLPIITAEELAFVPGETATFFIVRAARENGYWVAESPPDKHLKAFFGIVAEPVGGRTTRFHVFTTVIHRHWTGPVYFNLIRPFHHLVVWRMMKHAVRR